MMAGYCLYKLAQLNKLKQLFLTGKNGADLEEVLEYLATTQHGLNERQDLFSKNLEALSAQLSFAVQHVGIVRFNPFEDGGGNFSFCMALLDEHNTGVVLTSMHGRQQHRIYAKRITKGASDNPLTEEEQQAITNANSKQ